MRVTKKNSIPLGPVTNYDLMHYAKEMKIPNFREVYMRDSLPRKPREYQSAIVNLDSSAGNGTHWVCYKKVRGKVFYFDSFGNLKPPLGFYATLVSTRFTITTMENIISTQSMRSLVLKVSKPCSVLVGEAKV